MQEMILRRGVSWGDSGKQWALELTWHQMAVFQRRQPATGNARSPTVDSGVRLIASCMDDDRRRRRLEAACSLATLS